MSSNTLLTTWSSLTAHVCPSRPSEQFILHLSIHAALFKHTDPLRLPLFYNQKTKTSTKTVEFCKMFAPNMHRSYFFSMSWQVSDDGAATYKPLSHVHLCIFVLCRRWVCEPLNTHTEMGPATLRTGKSALWLNSNRIPWDCFCMLHHSRCDTIKKRLQISDSLFCFFGFALMPPPPPIHSTARSTPAAVCFCWSPRLRITLIVLLQTATDKS